MLAQKKKKEIGVYIYLGGLINKCGQKIYDTAFLFLSIRILMKRSLVTHKMKSQRRCNLSALLVVLVNTSKSKAFFLYLIFLFDEVVLYSTAKLNAGLYLHSHPWIHFRKCLLPLTGMTTNNYIKMVIKNIIGYLYKGKYDERRMLYYNICTFDHHCKSYFKFMWRFNVERYAKIRFNCGKYFNIHFH